MEPTVTVQTSLDNKDMVSYLNLPTGMVVTEYWTAESGVAMSSTFVPGCNAFEYKGAVIVRPSIGHAKEERPGA